MGSQMAPSYANIFMGKLEQQLLRTQERVPLVWWRYIDDVFAVSTHGEPALQSFVDELNRHHNTIKFTANWSTEEVTFLDTRVYLRNGLVETNLHIKPTDTHQYLRTDSCHPRHCKTDIPYGQALRLPKDIRNTTDFLNKLNSLTSLPPGSLLLTLDVSSLCTNIPRDE